jgi:ATP-dependent DNA helicase PIF1
VFPGDERTYDSTDKVLSDSPTDVLSRNVVGRNIEDFYRRTPEGMPEHHLKLKIGAIMMVIRNVNTNEGIANGTRVQIVKLNDDSVVCKHIEGAFMGETFPLARWRFIYGGTVEDVTTYGGVRWERLQFPLRPGFVMTINKAQGISFICVMLNKYHNIF